MRKETWRAPERARRQNNANFKMVIKVDIPFDLRRKFEAQADLGTWVIIL